MCVWLHGNAPSNHRWQKVLNPELVKGPWTAEEDARVVDLVNTHGAKKWSLIANCLPGLCGMLPQLTSIVLTC